MRRTRHHIVIDADGILDRSVRPDKLRWRDIQDVSLVHVDRDTYHVRLTLGAKPQVDIDLWGVQTPADAVFQEVVTRWQRGRGIQEGSHHDA